MAEWSPEAVALAVRLAFQSGYCHALRLVAERSAELDGIWRPVPRRSWEQQVAERVALFEACAVQVVAEVDAIRQRHAEEAVAA